jgi:AraC-like DNA-binding protein
MHGPGPARSDADQVRIWRVPEVDRVLLMHGRTTQYRVDPVGEYVVGICMERSFQATRARARYAVRPGDLVVWDPSAPHDGVAVDGEAWEARLLVTELPDLRALAVDPDAGALDLDFPDPVVRDRALARGLVQLHRVMEQPASALERQSMLASWLQLLALRSPVTKRRAQRRAARNDVALRRACEFLRDNLSENVTLEHLAAAGETSRFRIVRLFSAAFGAPPHAFQVAQRVVDARRLMEQGVAPALAAARVGFSDQSHLHRHFRPRLGLTPREYADAFARQPV